MMQGMNATTGRAIDGDAHLHQSIAKILTTPTSTRLQRRAFGADLADLVDAPYHDATRVRLYAATATALMRWEPRLKLTRVTLSSDRQAASGAVTIDIEGVKTQSGDLVNTSVQLTTWSAP